MLLLLWERSHPPACPGLSQAHRATQKKRSWCAFPIPCLLWPGSAHISEASVMAFPGRFTRPGTGVSKANARHRNAALAKGKTLENVQGFFFL